MAHEIYRIEVSGLIVPGKGDLIDDVEKLQRLTPKAMLKMLEICGEQIAASLTYWGTAEANDDSKS